MLKTLFLGLILCTTRALAADSKCATPDHRALDFWIGDWDTFEVDASGKATGDSIAKTKVESHLGDCVIHELYQQSDGLIGDSFLSYDGARKQWQQTWVTNRGSVMQIWGNFKDGALVLSGEMHAADGRVFQQKITWKKENGGVREFAVMSKDGGKTWEPAFDVLFLKKKA
jgi:hypothetical protein